MISDSLAPFLRRSSVITWAALLPTRGGLTGSGFADRFPLGAALISLAFLLARVTTGALVGAEGERAGASGQRRTEYLSWQGSDLDSGRGRIRPRSDAERT